ncbi:MAG: hypothetical protein OXG69_01850, partial [bacterium]|nr:hypothetical protein [bacterium]
SSNYGTGRTITVSPANDADSDDETVEVTFAVSGYGTVTSGPPVTVLVDDNGPKVLVTPTALRLDEGALGGYSISLNSDPGAGSTVTVTATPEGAGTPVSTTFDSDTWDSPRFVFVLSPQDDNQEDETFTIANSISASTSTHYPTTMTVPNVIVTYVDDDKDELVIAPATRQITLVEGDENHNTGSYTIALNTDPGMTTTVVVTSGNPGAVHVDSGGMPGASVTLTFTSGSGGNWSTPQTVNVTARDDVNGLDEAVMLTHTVTGYAADPMGFTVLTRDDDEVAVPGLTLTPTSLDVFANAGTATYTVQLNTAPSGNVTVSVTSSDTTHATVNPATLTFATSGTNIWSTPQTVTVTSASGAAAGDEATVTHSIQTTADTTDYPTGTVSGAEVAVAVVTDTRPTVTVAPSAASVAEGSPAVFAVTASPAPASGTDLTVSLTVSEATGDYVAAGNEGAGKSVTITGGSASVNFSVATVNDSNDEPDGSVTVTLGAGGNDYKLGSTTSASVTVTDGEATPVTLTRGSAAAVAEGAAHDYTITLGRPLVAPEVLPVRLTFSGTAARNSDYTLACPSPLPTGVACANLNTGTATVTFTGPTATPTTAVTLRLTAVQETSGAGLRESTETVDVGLGTLTSTSGTALGGGASAADSAGSLNITNVLPTQTVTMTSNNHWPREGATDGTEDEDITVTLGYALSGSETITVPLRVRGATVTDDYTFALHPATQNGVTLLTSGTYSAQNPALRFSAHSSNPTTATLRLVAVDNTERTQPAILIDFHGSVVKSNFTPTVTTSGDVFMIIVDDETGDIEVPRDWPLKPSGVAAAGKFRLFFVTSQTRDATPRQIRQYNLWIRRQVAATGHASIQPYAGFITVLGSTELDGNARENTGMWASNAHTDGSTSTSMDSDGISIWWLNGDKVADHYHDFFDGSWDGGTDQSSRARNQAGDERGNTWVWTGSNPDGTPHATSTQRLGQTAPRAGRLSADQISNSSPSSNNSYAFYGMSPVFQVEGVEASLAVSGGGNVTEGSTLTVTVNLGAAAPKALMIPVRMRTGGNPTASAADFTLTKDGTAVTAVSIASGLTSGTVTLTAVADRVDEDENMETFVLEFGRLPEGVVAHATLATSQTITITDADTAGVTVTESGDPANTQVDEDGTPAATDIYTVVLDSKPLSSVTIRVSTGTTTGANPTSGTVVRVDGPDTATACTATEDLGCTVSNWNSPQTVTVQGVQDNIDNPGDKRTIDITHAVQTGDTNGKYTTAMTIDEVEAEVIDDDAAPTGVTLTVDDDSVAEGGGAQTITVTATVGGTTRFGVAQTVTVRVRGSGTAHAVDFASVADFTITIAAGADDGDQTFTLTPVNDSVDEINETIDVTGHAITPATGVTFTDETITLTDDDAAPTDVALSTSPTTVSEGVAGGSQVVTVTATVQGTTTFGTAKTVAVSVAGHDAVGRVGFTQVNSFNVNIPAGSSTGTAMFTLSPRTNTWDEASGAAALTGTLAGVAVAGASVTLTDDDAAPAGIAFGLSPVSITEDGGARTISFTLQVQTGTGGTTYGKDIAVAVAAAGSGSANVVDFTASSISPVTITKGSSAQFSGSFTLTPTNDSNDEYDETVTVSATATDVHGNAIVMPAVDVTITDDEPTTVTMTAPTGAVAEDGGTKDITLTLSRALTGAETITVPVEVVGVTVASDYTLGLHGTNTSVTVDTTTSPFSAQNPAVKFQAGASAAVLRFTAQPDNDRTQPFALVRYGSGAAAGGGLDFGSPAGGPVGFVVTDDETGDILFPWDSPLRPTALNILPGYEFRLVFATSGARDASSTDIADYDFFIRSALAEGHEDIVPYAGFFTVVGSTSAVDASAHAGFSTGDTSKEVYWLGNAVHAERLGSYFDFRGEWLNQTPYDESGTAATVNAAGYFTGSTSAGAKSANPLGAATVTLGYLNDSGSGRAPLGSGSTAANTNTRPFYGLSPVLKADQRPTVSIVPKTGGESVAEGSPAVVTVSISPAPTESVGVTLFITDESGKPSYTSSADRANKENAVTFTSTVTSADYSVPTVNDSVDEPDGGVEVRVIGGTGYAAASSPNDLATVRVTDGEATSLTLTGDAAAVTEGLDKTFTMSLGRRLVSGETVTVPLTFAGTATRGTDYTFECSGTSVTCPDINSTDAGNNPRVVFANGAQHATITMAAVLDANTTPVEPNETVDIGMGTPTAMGMGGGVDATPTDSAPQFTIVNRSQITL